MKKLSENHQYKLATLTYLATACRLLGKNSEAIELYERVRDVQVKQVGADHPSCLTTIWCLANANEVAGNLPEAADLFKKAATGFEQREFQDADAVLAIRSLIKVYEKMNEFEQEEAWRRKWLVVQETVEASPPKSHTPPRSPYYLPPS